MKIKILLIIVFVFSSTILPQVGFSAGTLLGASSFSSNSPSVGGFATGFFIETDTPLFEEVFPRLGITFMKDINAVLPNNRKAYYPSMLGLNFKGITSQYFDSKIFLEEGIGLLALNDKTFIDKNSWEFGLALSFLAGYDMRNFNLRGLKTGAAVEYGLTFTGSLPSYLNFYLQFHYTF
ncbi:hypothetical protein [Ignavibacterium album]|uniref:hypothetical protein n=1 Tax=Ignavibacterium album TaxID=591197 RepID=UPI0002EC239B|nr:hypothetical protein [Ignavibacterium album]